MPTKAAAAETTYASVPDVQALAPSRKLGQGANPTPANVKVYLELTEGEINSILVAKGYSAPISSALSPVAFQLMREIAATGAVARLEKAGGNNPAAAESAEKDYQQKLKLLGEARTIMDAAQNIERSKPRGPGVTNVQASPGNQPMFSRDENTMSF